MDDRTLSGSQRVFSKLLGAEGAVAMEAESRAWMMICPHCGCERSVWEAGGVRYKASGRKRVLLILLLVAAILFALFKLTGQI